MAASSLKNAMAKKISKEVYEFYGKLEMKYYSGIHREDVPQKLAMQDLFNFKLSCIFVFHYKTTHVGSFPS